MAKILVVDDQLGVRLLLFETFREDRHEVEMAANGMEALRIFRTFQPNIILMDMKMPLMDGLETLKEIRTLDQRVSVMLMTAYGNMENSGEAVGDGILYYIEKPFDLFVLKERVRKILVAG